MQTITEILDAIRSDDAIKAEVYTDLSLSRGGIADALIINDAAAFAIAPGVDPYDTAAVASAMRDLAIGSDGYLFTYTDDDHGYVWDADRTTAVPLTDFYSGFFNLYFAVTVGGLTLDTIDDLAALVNGSPVSYEGTGAVQRMSEIRKDRYRKAAEILKQSNEVEEKKDAGASRKLFSHAGKYRVVDGKKYVRTYDSMGREEYVPVSNTVDPDAFYSRLLFGGVLGLHKFTSGQILSGILYLLTAGCCGVFWATDILSVLCGRYRLKDGSYLDRPSDMRHALLMLPLGVLFSAVILAVYFFGGRALAGTAQVGAASALSSGKGQQLIKSTLSNYAK